MGVMIDDKTWDMLKAYFLMGLNEPSLASALRLRIAYKCDKLNKRAAFTAYKCSPDGSTVREDMRQEYLDMVGVLGSFRSDSEYHEEQPPF